MAGFVSTDAFNGRWSKSPWNTQHYNVSSIGLKVNGQFTPSEREPYTPNFTSTDIAREFMSLYLSTGKAGMHEDDNGILQTD